MVFKVHAHRIMPRWKVISCRREDLSLKIIGTPLPSTLRYHFRHETYQNLWFWNSVPKISVVSFWGSGSRCLNANGKKNETTLNITQLSLRAYCSALQTILSSSSRTYIPHGNRVLCWCTDVHTLREFWMEHGDYGPNSRYAGLVNLPIWIDCLPFLWMRPFAGFLGKRTK